MSKMKELIGNPNLPTDLAFIKTYLSFLPHTITRLEGRGLSLADQVNAIEDARMKINRIPGPRGRQMQKKFTSVFEKNSGFAQLSQLSYALSGADPLAATGISRNPIVLSAYSHAPLTSVDLERSFSTYKSVLSDKRHNLTVENAARHVIVMHNSKFL